jgi:hypothetical protein
MNDTERRTILKSAKAKIAELAASMKANKPKKPAKPDRDGKKCTNNIGPR